ncbi:unnamed protein product [Menidia menidia]|uniref:(Atlantic silverside) hypothetical protein n=1 Tax=Menidia menidia TaxID=238744 RepID=A0A8S4B1Z3_9TELE|nr:unnamed protein product [Menidia menidia]
MSSYFVNSFSGRYPDGPGYKLLHYGASGGAMSSGTYGDAASAPAHPETGSYGHGYNGMDLTVASRGGGAGGGAFAAGDGRRFGALTAERGFRPPSSCSLASAAKPLLSAGAGDPKPCAQRSPPHPEKAGSDAARAPQLSGGAPPFFARDNSPPEAEDLLLLTGDATRGGSRPPPSGRSQPADRQEGGPAGAPAEARPPQIFPWMRKLHISHGTCLSGSQRVLVHGA